MRTLIPTKPYLIGLLCACFLQTPLSHAALIGLQPNSTFASNGDAISLDLVISGLGNFGPDSLGAFDISVGFDPGVLSFTSYSLGSYLGHINILEALDVSNGDLGGSVNLAEVSLLSIASLDALQPGEFTLATLNFNVVDILEGQTTQLNLLANPLLVDAAGNPLATSVQGPASVEGIRASVPEPGTLLLILASVLGVLTLTRRPAV